MPMLKLQLSVQSILCMPGDSTMMKKMIGNLLRRDLTSTAGLRTARKHPPQANISLRP